MATRKKVSSNKIKESKEYTTGRGIKLTVYPVPQPVINGLTPKTKKPTKPTVDMPIKGGGVQKRTIKEGDEGWEQYQEELQAWEDEKEALQDDVALCLALRDFDGYPGNGKLGLEDFPEYFQSLVDDELLEFPDNIYRRKALWLRTEVVGQNDELEIGWIVNELSGVSEEVIQQMKDSFRNRLLGQGSQILGASVGDTTGGEQADTEE